MLSNVYFLAKFRFDTAENEPAKNLQNFAKFANFARQPTSPRSEASAADSWGAEPAMDQRISITELSAHLRGHGEEMQNFGKILANFGKISLIFGCIGSDFCKKICVLQQFSKSTRFSS